MRAPWPTLVGLALAGACAESGAVPLDETRPIPLAHDAGASSDAADASDAARTEKRCADLAATMCPIIEQCRPFEWATNYGSQDVCLSRYAARCAAYFGLPQLATQHYGRKKRTTRAT